MAETSSSLSKRDFLAKVGGVAAAWGAGVVMGKLATERESYQQLPR